MSFGDLGFWTFSCIRYLIIDTRQKPLYSKSMDSFSSHSQKTPSPEVIKPEEAEKTEELLVFQKIPPQQETETSQKTLLGITVKSRTH